MIKAEAVIVENYSANFSSSGFAIRKRITRGSEIRNAIGPLKTLSFSAEKPDRSFAWLRFGDCNSE